MQFSRIFGSFVVGLAMVPAWSLADDQAELLFAKRVLPLFKEKCFGCHGNDPQDIKAELDMRSRSALERGGESGEASLNAATPLSSPLYLAIKRDDRQWSAMPPKDSDKFDAKQIKWVAEWLTAGAPWPSDERLLELSKKG
jgi:mono/diheme cytochrome c family protein